MNKSSKTKLYALYMEKTKNGVVVDWDLFGIYSTQEKAEKAKEWRKRENGMYEGVPGRYYNRCFMDTRIVDYNLPK